MRLWRRFRAWLSRLLRRPRPLADAAPVAFHPVAVSHVLEPPPVAGEIEPDAPIMRRERRPGGRAMRGLRR
jgi:hypothetical protein